MFPIFQCACSVLLNKIISSEKDLVGVVFFGTVSRRVLYNILIMIFIFIIEEG